MKRKTAPKHKHTWQVMTYNTHLDFQRILYLWRHISLLITCLTRIHNGKKSLQPVVNVDEASTFQMQLVHNANVRQWRNDGGWLVQLAALTLDGNKTQGTNKARVLCLEPKAVTVSKVNGYTQDGQALISSKGSSRLWFLQLLISRNETNDIFKIQQNCNRHLILWKNFQKCH
jgi:hypothetical protein